MSIRNDVELQAEACEASAAAIYSIAGGASCHAAFASKSSGYNCKRY